MGGDADDVTWVERLAVGKPDLDHRQMFLG
jgi:hypothetical protein